MSVIKVAPLAFVVDDDPAFCKILAAVLKRFGIASETFEDADSFMERLKHARPVLCIFDLNLGQEGTGFELITRFRSDGTPESSMTPVLVASGNNETQSIAHAIELGANDYILKPLDRDVLLAKLARYVQTYEIELSLVGQTSGRTSDLQTMMQLDGKILGVDELGITVRSCHLVSKGAVLSLGGKTIEALAGRPGQLLVTAVNAAAEVAENTYKVYFEFDPSDDALTNNVRQWLIDQTQQK